MRCALPALMLAVYALTLFCSASLLFIIEPMAGKMMLPLLGGTPAVWNTCMVFYQAVLLIGYAYAHWTILWLGPRSQARLQLAILLLPFASIIVNGLFYSGMLAPNENLILGNESNPIPALLLVLTLSIGLPMFVVCTSAPLLQRWFSSTNHPAARDPYFLYGASNLGSMLALIGYPLVIEPNLTLWGQQVLCVSLFTLLAGLVTLCAVLMWNSESAGETGKQQAPSQAPLSNREFSEAIQTDPYAIRKGKAFQLATTTSSHSETSDRPVDWPRRLRWLALSLVPSSLMLGVTTYITTDIAAIPLLWVLPLTLYLISFILVFAKIDPLYQSIAVVTGLGGLTGLLCWYGLPAVITNNENLLLFAQIAGAGIILASLRLLWLRDYQLIHRAMVMILPLLMLLLIFVMQSGTKLPRIEYSIALHCAMLFVASMVCHGELARDRPAPSHLTEFFLMMSFGGVVGGLFNALFAPVAFNSLAEYPLMMAVCCLLVPPLGTSTSHALWARVADISLAVVFVLVGGLLLWLRYQDGDMPSLEPLQGSAWMWGVAAIVLGGLIGGYATWKGWGTPPPDDPRVPADTKTDRVLDLVLPATLMVLVLGLFWGLGADPVLRRIRGFADMWGVPAEQVYAILRFGLPAVLCYTFVERSVRFGLGVGVILLVFGFSALIDDPPMYQERSFFGVLRVESSRVRVNERTVTDQEGRERKLFLSLPVNRLVHGTTLHGKQFTGKMRELLDRYILSEADDVQMLRELPLTYYHRSGPVGSIFKAYNTDPKRPIAVIGLGTGTMACYGLPGQTLDFYDIDPVVVDIAFDTNEYFTFVEDAAARGVDISLILGDARLTFAPKGEKVRLRPLHRRKGQPLPERQFGAPVTEDFRYGLIVVDAFSSDAIPVHLITRQAVKMYFDRLLEGGVLMMHISNRHLDLQPVLANIAADLGVVGYIMSDNDEEAPGKSRSSWVALVRDKKDLDKVFYVPRWQHDSGQLGLLGVALMPATSAGLMANSGLSLAFQKLAEQQTELAFLEQRLRTPRKDWWNRTFSNAATEAFTDSRIDRSGTANLPDDPRWMRGDWVPLDQPDLLEAQAAEAEKEIEELETQIAGLKPALEMARQRYKEVETPLLDIRKQLREMREQLDNPTALLTEGIGGNKEATLKRIDELKKRLNEQLEREQKLSPRLEEVRGPYEWLERLDTALQSRLKRAQNIVNDLPSKQAMARRVGVWTDDYSNILSVFTR